MSPDVGASPRGGEAPFACLRGGAPLDERDIAELLVGRGATIDLADGDIVTDMIVLCRVSRVDGTTSLGIAFTEGTSWLDQFGLVKAADNILSQGDWRTDDGD